jgi:hypothetical protein
MKYDITIWKKVAASWVMQTHYHSNIHTNIGTNIVTIHGVWTGNLYTRLGRTSNRSAIFNLRNSQITTAPAMSFPACSVFTSRFLATAANSGDSFNFKASHAELNSLLTLSLFIATIYNVL